MCCNMVLSENQYLLAVMALQTNLAKSSNIYLFKGGGQRCSRRMHFKSKDLRFWDTLRHYPLPPLSSLTSVTDRDSKDDFAFVGGRPAHGAVQIV